MSFDPFGDFETAGYLQNLQGLKDPLEVKESEHFTFELSLEEALAYLAKKKPLDYKAVLKTHQILFGGFYPWAGKDRKGSTPFPRTVLKGLKTSNLAGRLYDAFAGYETARCSRIDQPALHHEFDTTDGQHAPA